MQRVIQPETQSRRFLFHSESSPQSLSSRERDLSAFTLLALNGNLSFQQILVVPSLTFLVRLSLIIVILGSNGTEKIMMTVMWIILCMSTELGSKSLRCCRLSLRVQNYNFPMLIYDPPNTLPGMYCDSFWQNIETGAD